MRPTRRGYAVAAVAVAAVAVGAAFGARSLDAVVLPGLVALVAAAVQVWRAPVPTVERALPPAAGPDTTGTVTLRLDAPRTYPATIRDRLPPGVGVADVGEGLSDGDGGESPGESESSEAVIEGSIGGSVSYEIARRRRGSHEIGPLTVVVTDVLGLFERTHWIDDRDELLVFPRVRALSGAVEASLRTLAHSPRTNRRDEFDALREYVRGDALRDVHWKSSAKRGELMIREFTADADPDRVTVVAGVERTETGADESDPDETAADAMATAAATVCLALLDEGGSVTLSTPAGEVTAGDDARALLDHLADVGGGPVPTLDTEPDVTVVVRDGAAVVGFDGREHRFASLVSEPTDAAERGAAPSERAGGVDGADRAGTDTAGPHRIASTSGERRDGGPTG